MLPVSALHEFAVEECHEMRFRDLAQDGKTRPFLTQRHQVAQGLKTF